MELQARKRVISFLAFATLGRLSLIQLNSLEICIQIESERYSDKLEHSRNELCMGFRSLFGKFGDRFSSGGAITLERAFKLTGWSQRAISSTASPQAGAC